MESELETKLKFIGERIAELCAKNKVSERDVSLSLGKSQSYINYITNKRMYPTMKSLFEICEYFGITPSEFFDYTNTNPTELKEILQELKRLCRDNNTNKLLILLKSMSPEQFNSFFCIMEKYRLKANWEERQK